MMSATAAWMSALLLVGTVPTRAARWAALLSNSLTWKARANSIVPRTRVTRNGAMKANSMADAPRRSLARWGGRNRMADLFRLGNGMSVAWRGRQEGECYGHSRRRVYWPDRPPLVNLATGTQLTLLTGMVTMTVISSPLLALAASPVP